MSLIFLLVSLSSCSVILESDPQQVIQKVNFRVRVFLRVPDSRLPRGCPSHPPCLLSSRCRRCQGPEARNPCSSSRSEYWVDVFAGAGVNKRDLLPSPPL